MTVTRRELIQNAITGAAGVFVGAAVLDRAGAADDCVPPPPDCVPPTTTVPATTTVAPTTTSTSTTTTTTTTLPPVTTTLLPPTTIPPPTTTVPPSGFVNWSSQGYSGDVTIDRKVLLDVDADVSKLTITAAGQLVFDPATSRELRSTGNVIVRGLLQARPSTFDKLHRITFLNVDESRFAGGGMDPIVTDVGVWVMDGGQLDVVGSERLGWGRSIAAVAQGATMLTLDRDPVGWQIGDEIAIAPMRYDALEGWDSAKVTAISGRMVMLSSPCGVPHPLSPQLDAGGKRFGAEVLNLTRNVVIRGTEGGRAHVFVRSTKPQTIKYALLRYLGPQQGRDVVLGRYALHIHMCGDGSRGSEVTGVVVRDAGAHAYVPHMSNGVTFTDCVSHNTWSSAFWWDQFTASDDIKYLGCAATLARHVNSEGHGLTGFKLGSGEGLVCNDCVAVAIYGPDAAGFFWDAQENGIWEHQRCCSHTGNDLGIRVWQNNGQRHIVHDFVAFNHWGAGIALGAYGNGYQFLGGASVGNQGNGDFRRAQILVTAVSASDKPNEWHQSFVGIYVDAAGTETCLALPDGSPVPPSNMPEVTNCLFKGATKQSISMYPHGDPRYVPQIVPIKNCTFDGATKTRIESGCKANSALVLQ